MPKYCPPPAGAILYTVNEFCFLARFGRDRFYDEIKAGRVRTVKNGGRTMIPAAAAREFFHALGVEVDHA
jgi:hypothetical protein